MAVVYSDNRFDWCNSLAYARKNYNISECVNRLKYLLKDLKGADEKFVKAICAMDESDFVFTNYWFPVYQTTYTVTYIWDTEETKDKGDYTVTTTTTHTNTNTYTDDVYTGIYDSCGVNSYVGRNDQRFYKLSHVADLDGAIYNNTCVYSESEMLYQVNSMASNRDPGNNSSITVNKWYSNVYFTPILGIKYSYNGKVYYAYFNLHNLRSHYEFMVSTEAESWAIKGHRASVILRINTAILLGITMILLTAIGFNNYAFLKFIIYFAMLISGIIFLIFDFKLGHKLKYFRDTYGVNGNIKSKAYKEEIKYLITIAVCSIIAIVLFLII